MPLTGQAKTDYQREYMRRRRSNTKPSAKPVSVRPTIDNVRPEVPKLVRPEGLSASQWAYIQMKAEKEEGDGL